MTKLENVMKEIKTLTHEFMKGIYEQNTQLVKENEDLKKKLKVYVDKYGKVSTIQPK